MLFWNIIVHVIVNVQFMAERERERELRFKKKSYCYISFTYLSVIVFLNMFYGASKYSSRWGNSDVILILFHLMICMNFFFRTCIVNGYIFFNHCFFGFNLSIPSMVSVLYFILIDLVPDSYMFRFIKGQLTLIIYYCDCVFIVSV